VNRDTVRRWPGATWSSTTGADRLVGERIDHALKTGTGVVCKAVSAPYYHLSAERMADLGAYDLVLLLTAHAEFDPQRLVSDARLVVDTRNATGALGEFPHVVRL